MKQNKHGIHISGSERAQRGDALTGVFRDIYIYCVHAAGRILTVGGVFSCCTCLWALYKCREKIREGWRCLSGPHVCSNVAVTLRDERAHCFQISRIRGFFTSFAFFSNLILISIKIEMSFLADFCPVCVKCTVSVKDGVPLSLCDLAHNRSDVH